MWRHLLAATLSNLLLKNGLRLHSGSSLKNQLRLHSYFRKSLRLRPESTATLRLRYTSGGVWTKVNAVRIANRPWWTVSIAGKIYCNFSKSCMQRLRVAYNFCCRALYNLPWRASVSIHQVQCKIPTFEALLQNTRTCFSKDAENLTTYGYVLWCSQIVCTRHYSLNTTIAFYSVNEWSNFAVSVWSMACQATTLSHFT